MATLLELREKIYPIGSYVAVAPYRDTPPKLFEVIGYADDGRMLRVRDVEWPEYKVVVSPAYDKVKLYGNKNAVDKDQKNRDFL